MEVITEKILDKKIMQSKQNIFVFFAQERSVACRRMENDIRIAQEKFPQNKIYKLISHQEPHALTKFHIKFVPSLLVFQNGIEIFRVTGTSYTYSILQIFTQFS